MTIGFKKLHPDATIPTFGDNDTANAGVDLYAMYALTIHPKSYAIVDTGIAWDPIDIPYGKLCMIVQSRSGLAFKHQIEASNAGVLDSNFRGSFRVLLYNNGKDAYMVKKGERIAQGIIHLLPIVTIEEVTELSETKRGTNGFGSSGK